MFLFCCCCSLLTFFLGGLTSSFEGELAIAMLFSSRVAMLTKGLLSVGATPGFMSTQFFVKQNLNVERFLILTKIAQFWFRGFILDLFYVKLIIDYSGTSIGVCAIISRQRTILKDRLT